MTAKKRAAKARPVKRDRPVTSFTLTHQAIAALDDASGVLGVSRSAVVEMLVRQFVTELTQPKKR